MYCIGTFFEILLRFSWSFLATILGKYCVKYCDWVYLSMSVLTWSLTMELSSVIDKHGFGVWTRTNNRINLWHTVNIEKFWYLRKNGISYSRVHNGFGSALGLVDSSHLPCKKVETLYLVGAFLMRDWAAASYVFGRYFVVWGREDSLASRQGCLTQVSSRVERVSTHQGSLGAWIPLGQCSKYLGGVFVLGTGLE